MSLPSAGYLLQRFSLILFGCFIAALVGEISVRILSHFNPIVNSLVREPSERQPRRFSSLQEFLDSRPMEILPHRNWNNYWNNALGLNDREFELPKPAGRFRVMALGDSFCYGLVPYPENVLTLTEELVHRRCPNHNFDLLNFGIAATGVWDYFQLYTLANKTYVPDLIVLHFYMGNDGPDLLQHHDDLPRKKKFRSYLRRFLKNVWTAYRSKGELRKDINTGIVPLDAHPAGGEAVNPNLSPEPAQSMFNTKGLIEVLGNELGRFYDPPDKQEIVVKRWDGFIEQLQQIVDATRASGQKFALVLYPSKLQVYPNSRDWILSKERDNPRFAQAVNAINPQLPQKYLLAFCEKNKLSCLDLTPGFIAAARERSDEPLYIERDTHWTARGNAVAAELEAPFLESLVCK